MVRQEKKNFFDFQRVTKLNCQVPDDTGFNNDPIPFGLFLNVRRLSHWCDAHSDDIFENSWSTTARCLDGHINWFGMFVANHGTDLCRICVHEIWYLCNIWFYYCDDGHCIAMAVNV